MSYLSARISELFSAASEVVSGLLKTIKLVPSTVSLLEFEDALFHHNSAVLMPEAPTASSGDESDASPEQKRTSGLDVIRACLLEIEKHPEQLVLITGHTDTSGEVAYNLKLSDLRAGSVLAFLQGKKKDWVDIAVEKHKVEDYQQILSWIARTRGFSCDPGPVDDIHGGKTTAAVKNFQKAYNAAFSKSIDENGKVDRPTWEAFYDLYEERLLEIMDVVPKRLSDLRNSIKFLDDGKKAVGCGEHHPIDEPNRDNYQSAENRRVEILLIDPAEKPLLDCHPGPGSCKPELCQIHDRGLFRAKHIPVKPAPPRQPVSATVQKIETTDPADSSKFHDDDDLSPQLGEKARIHVKVQNLTVGAEGKLLVEVGRLTNRPDKPETPEVNESFTLIAKLEATFTMERGGTVVPIEWDGKSTVAVARELSDRQTTNVNTGNPVPIPLPAIASGDPLPHGLYVIENISVFREGVRVGRLHLADVDLSVPHLANFQFNGNWPANLDSFGIRPFQATLEEALRRFGGRDYQVRSAGLANRMNVRFVTDAGLSNADSMLVTIGGNRGSGLFGSTPDGPAPLSDNIYAIHKGLSADVDVFPGTFMLFNATNIGPGDSALFRAIFRPLGVKAGASAAAPGVASPRTVSGGAVTGACDATDAANVDVTLDDDGMATVASKDLSKVPEARARAIQRALRAFVRMVGNTTNHELAHALGVASRVRANNKLVIAGTTLTSPLDGDGGAHNKVTANTNIVDSGGTRPFRRRVEDTGNQQRFSAVNAPYLRDCIPFDRHEN